MTITISVGQLVLLIFIATALLIGAFVAGWNLSVYKFMRDRKRLAANYATLADKYETLANLMNNDPTRAGIEIGKEFTVQVIEKLVRDIRESMRTDS